MLVASKHPDRFPCLHRNRLTCECGGEIVPALTTTVKDSDGELIVIDKCPVATSTTAQRELIGQAITFVSFNVLPFAGGQVDQPVGFFEVVQHIHEYQNRNEASP